MRTITTNCFVDTDPMPDRTPAPLSAVEAFMATRTFQCQVLSARITPEQCAANQGKGLFSCGKCSQDKPTIKKAAKVKRAKRYRGDNPESPWHVNPGFIPKERRPELT
jgi:hypothetical protein